MRNDSYGAFRREINSMLERDEVSREIVEGSKRGEEMLYAMDALIRRDSAKFDRFASRRGGWLEQMYTIISRSHGDKSPKEAGASCEVVHIDPRGAS